MFTARETGVRVIVGGRRDSLHLSLETRGIGPDRNSRGDKVTNC